MKKEFMTVRQAICLIAAYICGSAVVLGGSNDAEQDSWISLIFSQVIVVPLMIVYARMMRLYPEKNLYEMFNLVFGKFISKVLSVVMVWYAIHLAALVLRNFSEFIEIISMPETPQLPLMIIMTLVSIYLARSGIETMGRFSMIVAPFISLTTVTTMSLLINQLDFQNLLPVMNHSAQVILGGSYKIVSFPFAESVLFLTVADSIRKEDSPYRVYIGGDIFGGLILIFAILRNITALGPILLKSEYFPSYVSARLINIGDFLVRIESLVASNFVLGGIVKIALCLIAASKGLAYLFNEQDYKKMVWPVALFALALGPIVYDDIMEMANFLIIYAVYAIPFQIIIPLCLWVGAEIKMHGKSKQQGASSGSSPPNASSDSSSGSTSGDSSGASSEQPSGSSPGTPQPAPSE